MDLDWSTVKTEDLKGFQQTVWMFFRDRRYARNHRDTSDLAAQCIYWFLAILSAFLFKYFPLVIFGFMCLVAFNVVALFNPFVKANAIPAAIGINLFIGSIGILGHAHFGLTLFHYHIEPILFWGYFTGGALALLRRAWNDWVWKSLDRIVKKYYQKQEQERVENR